MPAADWLRQVVQGNHRFPDFFRDSKKKPEQKLRPFFEVGKGCIYRFSLRRRTPAKPRMPEPNSRMLLGSGVDVPGLLSVKDSPP